jgi:hypothetical protein
MNADLSLFSIWFLFLCFVFYITGCQPGHGTKEELISCMKQYDRLILKTDGDSIALLYAPDGELGRAAKNRNQIRNFLFNFRHYKVLYQSSSIDSLAIDGDTAFVNGIYHQKVIVPENDTVSVKGTYASKWEWLHKEGWRIKRMDTHAIH